MSLHLEEWIGDIAPGGYWEVLSEDDWSDLEEAITDTISNELSSYSDHYPRTVMESESDRRVASAKSDAQYDIDILKRELDDAKWTIDRLRNRIFDLENSPRNGW